MGVWKINSHRRDAGGPKQSVKKGGQNIEHVQILCHITFFIMIVQTRVIIICRNNYVACDFLFFFLNQMK